MREEKRFTTGAILDNVIDTLENDFEGTDWEELHQLAFNSDYEFTDHAQAEYSLEKEIGVFRAIEEVKDYELDHFGVFDTPIEPCAIANMIVYIRGENMIIDGGILSNFLTQFEGEATDEQISKVLFQLSEYNKGRVFLG